MGKLILQCDFLRFFMILKSNSAMAVGQLEFNFFGKKILKLVVEWHPPRHIFKF